MILGIKKKIDEELNCYINSLDKTYNLSRMSGLLFRSIKDFISRDGKRVRPTLFVLGYLGFARKIAPGFYRSAVSVELLHDFMLVHDDIIDKSDTRRGKPSMHAMLNKYLAENTAKNIKFNGQDLAIVAGDVMYALALHAFLLVKENMQRKELALKKLIEAVIYTGSGEFVELVYGIKDLEKITKEDIYRIYDLKTANYTFASPLTIGSILAGAPKEQTDRLFKYGIYLGRAFQIKDDILGMFGGEAKIGKSNLTDLKESKKTILIWHAYRHTSKRNKSYIKRVFKKRDVNKMDLFEMRKIISSCKTLDFARTEIDKLLEKAYKLSASFKMRPRYKRLLESYSKALLSV